MTGLTLTAQGRANPPITHSRSTGKALAATEKGLSILERPHSSEDHRSLLTFVDSLLERDLHAALELQARLPTAESEKGRAQQILHLMDRGPDTKATVGMVALLVDAFPSGRPANPEGYLDAIVHDLVSMRFSPEVVSLACQTVRRSSKFLPSVSEIIEAANEARKHFDECQRAAIWAANCLERLERNIAKARERALQQPQFESGHFSDAP